MIPFTVDQFLEVFREYNLAVWPVQILLNILGLGAVVLAFRRTGSSGRIVATVLAVLWFWIGIVYHILFFSDINGAAYAFGLLFIFQGMFFMNAGRRGTLSFHIRPDLYGYLGGVLVLYALVLYPLFAQALGHSYPRMPTFGLPCPTVIFTFGLLLWTDRKVPWHILVVPFLWSVIGFSAAVALGMKEDFGLVIAGFCSTILLLLRDRKTATVS